ncbi:MAG: hypothetical protein HYY13_13590 [Nitrospirae bacterium]|nr:hypothetical protein [Nitrospirota bacterium]
MKQFSRIIVLAALLCLPSLRYRALAVEPNRELIAEAREIIVASSDEYQQRRRELERQREERVRAAYEAGKEEDKVEGFALGCLLGGLGLVIAYVMD